MKRTIATLLTITTLALPGKMVIGDPIPLTPVIYDLHKPPVYLDRKFAREMVPVAWCESRWGEDEDATNKVGKLYELGLLQLHPIHSNDMKRLGLDFYSEPDRLHYAELLWKESGWSKWSCGDRHA